MTGACQKHQFEEAENLCRYCGYGFCTDCLVYSFGPNKPPYCIACALTAAGVRSTSARTPRASRKDLRRQFRLERKAERTAARVEAAANATAPDPTGGLPPTAPTDDPADIDWSVPVERRANGWAPDRAPDTTYAS